MMRILPYTTFFFFFNDTATTEIYTLSLHDALPISDLLENASKEEETEILGQVHAEPELEADVFEELDEDRKSTRLNSSHSQISYAVFCLKKKKTARQPTTGGIDPERQAC